MVEHGLAAFEDKNIRRTWHKDEWWFSVVDVVGALTESVNARDYWYRLKQRELEQTGVELSTFCRQLKLPSSDGKSYETDCSDTEGLFRIIQSIPSKKAEPFKLWLAKVGYDRVKEIENPELAQDRAKVYYERKGYPPAWIEKRLRGIAIRQDLTDEWKDRGIAKELEFAILTDEISKATFDKTVTEYRELKGLERKNQSLRDHMTDWELIFTMLGEKATTDIAKTRDAQGLGENKKAAKRGGEIARNARHELESEIQKPVVTSENADDIIGKRKLGKR